MLIATSAGGTGGSCAGKPGWLCEKLGETGWGGGKLAFDFTFGTQYASGPQVWYSAYAGIIADPAGVSSGGAAATATIAVEEARVVAPSVSPMVSAPGNPSQAPPSFWSKALDVGVSVASFAIDNFTPVGDVKDVISAVQTGDVATIATVAAVTGASYACGALKAACKRVLGRFVDAAGAWFRRADRVVPDGPSFFRGSRPGESPSFTPRPNEYKVDRATGTVKSTHGVSVYDNADSVSARGFEPHQLDLNTVPSELRIIQRGQDLRHYEIVPQPGANLTPGQYTELLECIRCVN